MDLGLLRYNYYPSANAYEYPTETLGIFIIFASSFALILGLTNWRLGLWLKEYDVRLLNILSGLAGIIIGLILIFG